MAAIRESLLAVLALFCMPLGAAAATQVYWTAYYSEYSTRSASRCDLNGDNAEALCSAQWGFKGVAIDFVAGTMYLAARGQGTIERADLDGSNREAVLTGVHPIGLALDLAAEKLYWADYTWANAVIMRSNLDGTGVETLTRHLGNGCQLEGLVVHVPSGRMYWIERKANRIRRANLDGSELQIILTCADHAGNSYDLAIHDGHLYWTDWLTRSINRADLDGGNVVEGVVSDIDSPVGLAIDHVAGKFYWVSDRDKSLRRANLDGSGVETIVSGVSNPYGVALNYDPSSLPVEDFVRIRGVSFSGPETIDISALARPGKPFVLESTGSLLSPFKDHAGAAQTSQPDGSLSWTVSVGQARQAYFRVRARDSGP
jgi:hypothetical protein